MFLESTSIDPARPALWDPASARWWSHGELRDRAAGLARGLAAGGRGLAFLLCRNTAATVAAYLAAVDAGWAVGLLDARTPAPALARLLELYRPELVAGASPVHDAPGPAYEATPLDGGLRTWRRVGGNGEPPDPALAALLSTSGSTGSPKLVRLTRRNLEANAASIRAALAIGADERAMACLPLHYSYGLSVVNSHLLAGASAVLTDETPIAPSFWRLFRAEACTSMPGVPYTYELLTKLAFERLAPPSLRTLTQAGGKLRDELVWRFHEEMVRRGGRFHVMYGQTEATARIACLPPEALPAKLGSVGRAIPGGELAIERDGGPPAPGERGEIVYRGPNVMMGYAERREDLARGDELGGVLRTGDLGWLDGDGFLYVTGRTKRIGKVLGLRVSLDEVEALLRAHGPTAVVAGDDRLVVYCEYGDEAAFAALARDLARELRVDDAAFRFRRVAALPLTASGKIDYGALPA